jgi:2-oxo-4-hydroxy-4-carboxy-5-ureidoimidazoline decarboxylase
MTLHEFNILPKPQLISELTRCCGSQAWVQKMLPFIPADDMVELLEDAEEQWWKCSVDDWKEAFAHHPKIGDKTALREKFGSTANWASDEQSGTNGASEETIAAFADANKKYEEKFGYIFIIYATGKSAAEMLTILQERLKNDAATEIEIAADEQSKITRLRLEKLLQ